MELDTTKNHAVFSAPLSELETDEATAAKLLAHVSKLEETSRKLAEVHAVVSKDYENIRFRLNTRWGLSLRAFVFSTSLTFCYDQLKAIKKLRQDLQENKGKKQRASKKLLEFLNKM